MGLEYYFKPSHQYTQSFGVLFDVIPMTETYFKVVTMIYNDHFLMSALGSGSAEGIKMAIDG